MSAPAMRLKAAAGQEFTACDALTGRYCSARTACHLIVRRGRGVLQTFPSLTVSIKSRHYADFMILWLRIDEHRRPL